MTRGEFVENLNRALRKKFPIKEVGPEHWTLTREVSQGTATVNGMPVELGRYTMTSSISIEGDAIVDKEPSLQIVLQVSRDSETVLEEEMIVPITEEEDCNQFFGYIEYFLHNFIF